MSIIQGSSISASSTESGGFYDFPIEQSLRFNGSSYLSRTFVSGSTNGWTMSFWVKFVDFPADYENVIFFKAYDGRENVLNIYQGTYQFYEYKSTDSPPNNFVAKINGADVKLRDFSAWYHMVIKADISGSVMNTYLNGVSSINYTINQSETVISNAGVANFGSGGGRSFKGYLANIQFIDGQALDASYFGETKQDIWTPKTFDGTSSTGGSTVSTDYGTNGFLLDFNSISGTTINDTAPIDTNHSSANNWTATGF